MKSIRIGNDIRIEWPVTLGGGIEGLDGLDLSVWVRPSAPAECWDNYAEGYMYTEKRTVMMNGGSLRVPAHDCRDGGGHWHRPVRPPHAGVPARLPFRVEGNKITALWSADRQFAVGDYDIILYARKNKAGQGVCDQYRFVRLVAHSAQADAPDGSGIEAVVPLQPVTLTLSGLSAYEIAVIHGFKGTEDEWLDSLSRSIPSVAVTELDGLYSKEAVTGGKPSRYTVTCEAAGGTSYTFGVLDMFSDSMRHQLTQVLTTHYAMSAEGVLDFTLHNDNRVSVFFRSYHIQGGTSGTPVGTWGQWRLFCDSDVYSYIGRVAANALMKTDRGAAGGVASLGDDGKVPQEQLPDMPVITAAEIDEITGTDNS